MEHGLLVLDVFVVEEVLYFGDGLVAWEDVSAEVKDEIEKVSHLMSQDVVADVLSTGVLLVEDAYPYFQPFFSFGDKNSHSAIGLQIFLQSGVAIEVLQLFRGELQQLVNVCIYLVFPYKLLIDFELFLPADIAPYL